MDRNVQRFLFGSKSAVFLFGVTVLAIALLAGCGGSTLKAPENAGTAQDLAGTRWTEPESNTTYSFVDDADVDVNIPNLPEPMLGSFTVNNGIINVSIGLKTQSGTWDGSELVIEGKPLTRD